jgi:hypothetical protein
MLQSQYICLCLMNSACCAAGSPPQQLPHLPSLVVPPSSQLKQHSPHLLHSPYFCLSLMISAWRCKLPSSTNSSAPFFPRPRPGARNAPPLLRARPGPDLTASPSSTKSSSFGPGGGEGSRTGSGLGMLICSSSGSSSSGSSRSRSSRQQV